MNILVVDDEIYCVQGIIEALDWAAIGIEKVLPAYSMKHAQTVFENEKIDILLADIEMPKGSGLDLLDWACGQGYHPVTLFLTSYAKFEYAQKAIQMQCFGYIVKPAGAKKLEEELRRAVGAIKRMEEQKKNQNLAEYWDSQLINRTEAFWYELFHATIQPDEKNIRRALQKRQLPLEIMSQNYFYILVQVKLKEESANWEKDLLNHSIRNVLSETLYHEAAAPVPNMEENHYMLMCRANQYTGEDDILAACNEAAKTCEKSLPGKFALFVSGPAAITEAVMKYKVLRELENNFFTAGSIALSEKYLKETGGREKFQIPIEAWSELLLTHHTHKLVHDVERYLTSSRSFYPRTILNELYYGILQVIYISLDKRDALSQELFINEKTQRYISIATDSIEGFLGWMEFILKKAETELAAQEISGSMVDSVRQYVRAHLTDQDLSRSRIASEIHLNPDYLSFTFHDKSGQSLTAFIASERIRAAKKLLITTDLPIGDISTRTGFTDISYFSKQFKQLIGMTPQQYRKSVLRNSGKI
jgi:two-component system, response regulator YesN